MGKYALRRLMAIVPAVILATVVIFLFLRVLPGDVALTILADTPHSLEMREALREELGLNDPAPEQYIRWLWNMFNGQFGGDSLETGEPIAEMVGRQAPVTLLITFYTVAVSLVFGLPVGIWTAMRPNRIGRSLMSTITLAGLSVPNVLLAALFLLGLLRLFRWSPPIIYATPGENLGEHLQMVVWPVLILSIEYGSHLTRMTYATLAEVLKKEYITAALGRGVPRASIALRHASRAVTGPLLNIIGLQFGTLLGGTLVLESIFGIPGIGRGLIHAAVARDLPVVQSYATLLVVLFLVINLVIDVAQAMCDPRISTGRAATS